jgi:ElaB/YqjD/DUF883 family membrane-anchored ribosome-binding protein
MSINVEKAARKAGDKVGDLISNSKKRLQHLDDRAYEAGKQARKFINSAEENIRKGTEGLEEQIKARPFVAIGSALLLGMIIAKAFGRSKD